MERALDSGERTTIGTNDGAACFDLAVAYRARLLRLMVTCSVACAATTVASGLISLPKPIEYFLFGLALYGGFIFHDRLVARSARQVLLSAKTDNRDEPTGWHEDIREWARRAGGSSPLAIILQPRRAAIATAAQFLADLPDAPRTLRLTPLNAVAPTLPAALDTRIEPTLLQSVDPRFWETFPMIPRPTIAHRLAAIPLAYGSRFAAKAFIFVSLGLAAVGFGILGIQITRSLLLGAMPPILVQIAGMSAAGMLFILAQRWRVSTWFAVHGGLLITESLWHRTSRDLHRFTPADSVLLYWPETRQLAVARRGGPTYARPVQPPEAEAAIAAWMSPLPCPPMEQFSDLR